MPQSWPTPKNLSDRPDNAALLKIYALYKQASTGDNTEPKPDFSDPVAHAEWDIWTQVKALAQASAIQRYIELIAELA